MINFIKKNIFVVLIFIITLSIGILTFFTFIDKSFIKLTENNLQLLLIVNILLLLFFFIIIFIQIKNSLKGNIKNKHNFSSLKYITFFSFFTLVPSILISVFSLFLFSFALDKYFDKKITTAVNNSYEIAKNYVEEVKNKIESDIVLVALDLNKNVGTFYDNPNKFKNILKTQQLIRGLDEIHLIDSSRNLIVTTIENINTFKEPSEKAIEMVFNDERPLKIINAFENKSAAIIKLNPYIDTYLYVVKFLDPRISNYLKESREALNFYYIVESKKTGIKVSFALIYLIIVSLLLFLSISLGIKFSSRFLMSISNLISASSNIGKGNLSAKVPIIETDKELQDLNKNFNLMIDRLKLQQDKLLLSERHEAWENVARKLAHEIKNPLTPIQLTIDRIKNKYLNSITKNEKTNFNNYLLLINKQIKLIENLVNEFSDFARMPKPIFKKHNLVKIINSNIDLLKEINKDISINFNFVKKELFLQCDFDQINRVFLNIIKNSIESISEKTLINNDFNKKINIEISDKNDYIKVNIIDNGLGFQKENIINITKPYYTTKSNGTGLGLPIVNKIINDHLGTIKFKTNKVGAEVEIILPKDVS